VVSIIAAFRQPDGTVLIDVLEVADLMLSALEYVQRTPTGD
jgi:hypothetical protein